MCLSFCDFAKPSIIRHVIEESCLKNHLVLDLKVECHQISSLSHFIAYGMGARDIFKNLSIKNRI